MELRSPIPGLAPARPGFAGVFCVLAKRKHLLLVKAKNPLPNETIQHPQRALPERATPALPSPPAAARAAHQLYSLRGRERPNQFTPADPPSLLGTTTV